MSSAYRKGERFKSVQPAGSGMLRPGPHRRPSRGRQALVFAVLCLSLGCDPVSLPAQSRRTPVPLSRPPGASEENPTSSFQALLAEGEAHELARHRGEALRAYARALELAPADLPSGEREKLEDRARALSFSLGVQEALPASAPTDAAPAAPSEALLQARALYTQAVNAEQAGQTTEARAAYARICTLIRESDDAELYWNAWQKREDLRPEGEEAPAAAAPPKPSRDLVLLRSGGALPTGLATPEPSEDGSAVAGERASDINLSRARQKYMEGMGYARSGDKRAAQERFSEVLELISENADPELLRAARQNLEELQRGPKAVP